MADRPESPRKRTRQSEPSGAKSGRDRRVVKSVRYLNSVLPLNPLSQSDRIVTARSKFLGIDPQQSADEFSDENLRDRREELADKLDEIRREFWSSDLQYVQSNLSKLRCGDFPDLEAAAIRLQRLAANRHHFGALAEEGLADPKFFKSFRIIMVAPPRIADSQRDKEIESIRSDKRLKRVKKMVKQIRREMPDVYELERDWLDAVAAMRPRGNRGGNVFESNVEGLGCAFWIVLFVLARVIIRMLVS